MSHLNTMIPVNLEEESLHEASLEDASFNEGSVSGPYSEAGSSFEQIPSRTPSVGSQDERGPLPPSHDITPARRSFSPPATYTTRDGARGFDVRPKSYAHTNKSVNRLSTASLGLGAKSEFRLNSSSPAAGERAPIRSSVSPGVENQNTTHRASQYGLTASTEKYVGDAVAPRIETIELYRKSAAKSNDPDMEFELAQYMVQTALLPSPEQLEKQQNGAQIAFQPKKKTEFTEEEQVKRKLLKEAMGILRKLAERGHATSQYLLGDLLSTNSPFIKKNPRASFQYFISAAKHKHVEAAYRAGLCLQEGWGTPPDAHKALKMYKTAASKNQPGALFRLGMAHFYGQLGLADNANNRLTALKWLTRAVNAANEIYNKAPYELGRIYEQGYKDVVFADQAYAVKLYVRSAELNYVPAAAKLGKAYEFGEIGCPQDAILSIHYYTIAALGGDANSQLSMCAWYLVGAGPRFPRNEDEAFEWALRAAHNGLARAQTTLGMFYEKGIGCHRDIFQSTTWYGRAADNGDEYAINRLQSRKNGQKDEKEPNCVIM